LRERVLLMGARVEEMIEHAMQAFSARDLDLAQRTIDRDAEIDWLEKEIDELCIRILARRQPVASDLRFITTAFKHVTDLERIGDLAVNICERVLELGHEPPLTTTPAVERMAAMALQMLHDALDAFVNADVHKAEQVMSQDETVDAYYAALFPELVAGMTADSQIVFRATRLLSLGKYLERIADHATNLAEMVVFMVKGKDVRHPASHPF
jgi:phosphate transport system protein